MCDNSKFYNSVNDMEEIQKQFDAVISFSQDLPQVNTDTLFHRYIVAKQKIIKQFGGKLIIELPEKVTFELSEAEKQKRVKDFLTSVDYNYENSDLAAFIDCQKEGFYDNKVITDYEYNQTKIPKGMKLFKAFKYFEDDTETLESIQTAASMLVQEDKITGTLCLSVHPLDFISASENCHNWHSCHALDGEYRSGNVSYMVDPHTIMCYLRADKDYILPDFPNSVPWNSKKWRVWFYLSKDWDILFAGRQYPFTSAVGLNMAKKELIEKVFDTKFTDFSDKYIEVGNCPDYSGTDGDLYARNVLSDKYMTISGRLYPFRQVVKDAKFSLAFDDLTMSSCYVPQYAYKIKETRFLWEDTITYFLDTETKGFCYNEDGEIVNPKFTIGGEVGCFHCGKKMLYPGRFICGDCEDELNKNNWDTFKCEKCGGFFNSRDGYISLDGTFICKYCADINNNKGEKADGE